MAVRVPKPRLRRRVGRLMPKAITDWNRKRIGAVTLALIVAIVAGALLLTSSVFSSTYPVRATFANAVGLAKGDQVLLAGVAIGKVSSVQVVGNHVVVDLAINDGVQLPSDSSAHIAVQSLLGVIGVNITPGGNWAHLLSANSTIRNTSVPFEYFEVQNASGKLLSATDAHALGQVVSDLEQATSGDKAQIQQIIDGLGKATTAIDQHRNAAAQLIDAAEALSGTLAAKDHQLATVVDDLDLVMKGLASRSNQLGQFITQTEQAAYQMSSLLGRNQPRLQQMLDNLHTALAVIGQHQVDVARSVAFAASAITGFASVGKSGNVNTPWANIYTNILGSAVGYGVLGNCGALDQALDVALGPDPRPCNQRSGPPVQSSGSGSGSGSGTSPGSTSAASLVLPLVGGSSASSGSSGSSGSGSAGGRP
jgi:phospholipid/cholesterol/gamma-HCH transport system substrate-binding protein